MRFPIVVLIACAIWSENDAFSTKVPTRDGTTVGTTSHTLNVTDSAPLTSTTVVRLPSSTTTATTTTSVKTTATSTATTTASSTTATASTTTTASKTTTTSSTTEKVEEQFTPFQATTKPTPAVQHPGDCDFDTNWCNWLNLKDDQFDWVRNKGRTASSSTGPEGDVTGRDVYVYIEASWPRRPGNVARLSSPMLNGTQCMRFKYNMYGRYMGDLQIYVKDNKSMIFLWGRYKNQGQGWHSTNVTVYGINYRVLLMGRVGKSYTSDMAIDAISFVNGTCDGKPLFSSDRVTSRDISALKQEGELGSCNFDGGFCEWINVPLGDDFDWTLHRGSTATKDTGPQFDHTRRKGFYLYIESSTPRIQGHIAQLLSPRLCGTMCLQLYYHLYGSEIGELTIYQRRGLGTDDRIWHARGEHRDTWHEALIDISGNCYQIVIEGVIGRGYLGDAAIDDVIFTKGTCCTKQHRHFDVTKGSCSFDDGYCQWKNSLQGDDFNWSLLDTGTPSTKTGPDGPFSGTGQYAFVESSEPRLHGDKAVLVGPVLSGFVCLKFKYHMYGQHTGSLTVYKHGSGVHRQLLWHRKGNMGNLWRDAAINIDCREPSFQIEFEAVINGWRSDIAIDEIVFSSKMCNKTVDAPIVLEPTLSPLRLESNGDCSFPGTFCEWKNDRDDDFDWEIGSAATPSLKTGPNRDVDGNGRYLFIEASRHLYRHKASLTSGYMRGKKCMTFHYHMFGRRIGILSIRLINLKINYKTTLWYRSGNQGQHWVRAHLNIDSDEYKLAIVGEEGGSTAGDIAIDDISFQEGRCPDLQETVLDDELPSDTPTIKSVPFKDRSENCTFDDFHMCKWINVFDDQFDWRLWKGATPSRRTGPSSGHGGKGMYIYTEATAPRKAGDKARITLSRSASVSCIRFYYHMYGVETGELRLFVADNRRQTTVWIKRGPQTKEWLEAMLTITSDESYQVIFEAEIGRGFQSDIALDDITFSSGPCIKPALPLFPANPSSNSTSDSMQGDCPNCVKTKT